MPRQLRIQYEGAFYHITSRGVERRKIFIEDQDYEKFYSYLEKTAEIYHLIIHAFCLMPNHYHIECETPRANLSEAMQWLNTSYTVYFNRRHKRSGHLFQGRYKALLVEKESYLSELNRYIHLNPLRAKLVKKIEDYRWSSYLVYLGKNKKVQWVETEDTLKHFGNTERRSRRNYQKFIEEGTTNKLDNPTKNTIAGTILGDESFVNWIRDKFLNDKALDSERPAIKKLRKTLKVQKIIQEISNAFNVNSKDILKQRCPGFCRNLQHHFHANPARIGDSEQK